MFKKYRILKWIIVFIAASIVLIVSFGLWFKSLIPHSDPKVKTALVENLPYLSENKIPLRGKILAVVTSTGFIGNTEESTGYELTELSRAYYTFKANGFEVDIASPKGGKSPVVIDEEDMVAYDYAFLKDEAAQYKTNNTLKIANIVPEDYQAIYFVGGKGAMFDFPNNKAIQTIVKNFDQANKVIGAVCHGPSALVNVTLDNGQPLLKDRRVSGFTNKEELLLIPDAKTIFPFLLQDKMVAQGAYFNEGAMYLENISHDKNLITGQNPWSTWSLAESIIQQLGYTPKHRKLTDEENAVKVLITYKTEGKKKAKKMIEKMLVTEKKPISRILLLKHSIIAAMQGKIGDTSGLLGLVSFVKKSES
ncbi:type 1 glutamine amidotransferase domain-containing protein [Aquimarina sp. MMG016]|uniref:type 1 glutamine amidotransferase domain-containing protein n=1 Tax=Aquimarina sp. MMG016 TaxID=2822690 RepID=UPI001B39FF7B|nr:type 1 glutamine amidotransferase domain-containing protein [Aquimarina sp. MMG016]MBQ4819483.1 type 1 glutamine amidotransferase domain-containing protein [Aquimarina sp. MMG016]